MEKRKKYTDEFKREAVRLYETSGKTQAQIEIDLGLWRGCISRWKKDLERTGEQAFPGQGRLTPDDERIRKLERENEILRQERDILKKAMAIFSQPSR
jgi:transposase